MGAADNFINRKLMDLIKGQRIGSICDYGCGSGELLRRLRERVSPECRLVGVDYFLRWPVDSRPGLVDGVQFIDRESDEFKALLTTNRPDEKFDLVISSFALHHFRLPVTEMGNLRALSASQGRLLVIDFGFENKSDSETVKNITSFAGEMLAAFRGKFHRHHYTLEEALDLFKAIPVQIIDSGEVRLAISDDEKGEDLAHSIRHHDHDLKAIQTIEKPILVNYLTDLAQTNVKLLKQCGIDYSLVFFILGQRKES